MKRLILGYCLVMALGMSVPTAGAAEEPSAAGRAAATELLSVMNLERTMMGVAVAMADAMIQQNAALQPYREVMLEWAGKTMAWKEVGPKLVDIYADSFSEAELREVTAFYRTPTGQKALGLMPELTRRGAMLGSEAAGAHVQELEGMIRARAAEIEKGQKKQ